MKITLKQARIGVDMTQQEVADRLGVHVTTYGRMEAHPEDITFKQGSQLAQIFKINVDDIFFIH